MTTAWVLTGGHLVTQPSETAGSVRFQEAGFRGSGGKAMVMLGSQGAMSARLDSPAIAFRT